MIEKLFDEESRVVYKARIEYAKDEDNYKYWNAIKEFQKKKTWICSDNALDLIRKSCVENREIVLFGSGKDGFASKEALELLGISVSFFCDNNCELYGSEKYGVKIISPSELVEKHSQALVLVTTRFYGDEVEKQLLDLGILAENIVRLKYGKVLAICPSQYFDVFGPCDNEVFVDAGAFDGATTLQFIDWANHSYRAAYVMEPFESAQKYVKKNLKNEKNIHIVNKAAWNVNGSVSFGGDERGSSVGGGNEIVETITIDDMVRDDPVTFIKMDIEGSEYEALLGAKQTIINEKPKLAISVYHKLEDTERIMQLLDEYVPEYKYALRHYSTCMWETVLYAWVDR